SGRCCAARSRTAGRASRTGRSPWTRSRAGRSSGTSRSSSPRANGRCSRCCSPRWRRSSPRKRSSRRSPAGATISRRTRSRCTCRGCARSSSRRESGSARCAASATCWKNTSSSPMADRSLRAHLLRLLLPPIAALLVIGALVAYYPSVEPANQAYDQALVDIGLAIGNHIRVTPTEYRFDLPAAVEQVLRTDRFDSIYYRVMSPAGLEIAGDADLPAPPGDQMAFNTMFNGEKVRVMSVQTPCGRSACTVLVAETMVKRTRATRDILFQSLFPDFLIALATLVIVWFGVKRGLQPLARLSEEIKARSSGDLRPIDAAGVPEEARPLVGALNGLLDEVSAASRKQQRFLADAAHQLRTPLAGLQAHTEIALAQQMPEACRAQLEQVHKATIRTARLANQLLALARAEPGARSSSEKIDLKDLA